MVSYPNNVKDFSTHSTERRMPTLQVLHLFPIKIILKRESFPSIIRTDAMPCWRQQSVTPFLNIHSTTMLNLPLERSNRAK